MDIPKLEGLISAIESESRAPAPSHSNLARLVALICKELVKISQGPSVEVQSPPVTSTQANATVETVTPEPEELEPKKKRKSKK